MEELNRVGTERNTARETQLNDFHNVCAPQVKTDSLSARYDAVSQTHSERFSALEQAQVLVARFWETYEELEPWLGETETLITQLPPPAIDTDALRLQQDQMRVSGTLWMLNNTHHVDLLFHPVRLNL